MKRLKPLIDQAIKTSIESGGRIALSALVMEIMNKEMQTAFLAGHKSEWVSEKNLNSAFEKWFNENYKIL